MTKLLVFIVVIWVLARLAKRWLLAKAQKMQQNLEAQLRAQMHQQMNQQMGSKRQLDQGQQQRKLRPMPSAWWPAPNAACISHKAKP